MYDGVRIKVNVESIGMNFERPEYFRKYGRLKSEFEDFQTTAVPTSNNFFSIDPNGMNPTIFLPERQI